VTKQMTEHLRALGQQAKESVNSFRRQQDLADQMAAAIELDPPNYSVLLRHLQSKVRQEIEAAFPEAADWLAELQKETEAAWADASLFWVGEFVELAKAEDLAIEGKPPKLKVGRGIDVEFRIRQNRSLVNGTQLLSVDPRDVLRKVKDETHRLWESTFDARAFLDELFAAFTEETKRGAHPEGVPILSLYERLRENRSGPAKTLFTKELFAAHLSRAIESGATTTEGPSVELRPTATASEALWIYNAAANDWAYRGRVLFKEV
jgi:hypothetical protein